MPRLGKIRQAILDDLKARTIDLYRDLGDLRLVGKAVGKSHTWVANVLKSAGDNHTLQKDLKNDSIK